MPRVANPKNTLNLCAQAINQAHASMRHQDLFVASGSLVNASVNRSPTAYAANPGG